MESAPSLILVNHLTPTIMVLCHARTPRVFLSCSPLRIYNAEGGVDLKKKAMRCGGGGWMDNLMCKRRALVLLKKNYTLLLTCVRYWNMCQNVELRDDT